MKNTRRILWTFKVCAADGRVYCDNSSLMDCGMLQVGRNHFEEKRKHPACLTESLVVRRPFFFLHTHHG